MIVIKRNIKTLLFSVIILLLVIWLKKDSVETNDYVQFIRYIMVAWSDNLFQNLIWLAPILLTFYVLGKKYFEKLLDFDMRYHNRFQYIKRVLRNFIIESFCFNSILFLFQASFLTLLEHQKVVISFSLMTFFVQYVLEITFALVLLLLLSFFLKTFVYSYLLLIFFIFLGLIVLDLNRYLPFLNLFYGITINPITLLGIIIALLLIIKIYKHYDIGGIES